MTASTAALVTGANSGLGYAATAELARRGFSRIVLVTRSMQKGEDAKVRLVKEVGSDPFEVVAADMGDFASVRTAVGQLEGQGKLDYVLLNAGLMGSSAVKTADEGIEVAMAASVVGHHVLTSELLSAGLISANGTIVIAGSEAARGDMPTMYLTDIPEFAKEHTGGDRVKAIDALLHGRAPYVYNNAANYAMVKVFVAWWAAEMARRLPEGMTVYAVSPGNTPATNAMQHQPLPMRIIMGYFMVPMMQLMGLTHSLEVAVERYLAPLTWGADRSGEFWASKPGAGHAVGPIEKMVHSHFQDRESEEALWTALVAVTGANVATTRSDPVTGHP